MVKSCKMKFFFASFWDYSQRQEHQECEEMHSSLFPPHQMLFLLSSRCVLQIIIALEIKLIRAIDGRYNLQFMAYQKLNV